MSVMNGVDSEEIIGHRIGMQHMMDSMIKIASERTGHCVRFNPEVTGGCLFGEADGSLSWRVAAIENLFNMIPVCDSIFQKISSKNMGEICLEYQYESASETSLDAAGRIHRDSAL